MKKRLISLLLVVMMLFTLTGPYAFSAKAPSQEDIQVLNNEKTTEDSGCEHQFADGICTVCGGLADNVKFYFGVTSENTVDVVAYNNYSAVVRLPENGTVNTKSVSVKAALQNVASLGISGVRSHEIKLDTSEMLGENEVDLTKWLSNAYNFDAGEINAVIDGKAVTYKFDAVKDNKIAATTDTAAARAAWQALTANVSTEVQAADDSRAVLKNGSYIKIGTECLRFEKEEGDLVIDNLSNVSGLMESVRSALYLDECDDMGAVVEIFVKKGTQLAVGQSIATLDKDCLITIDFGDADEITGLKGCLTELRDAQSVYALVMDLVELFNAAIGVVDSVSSVTVDVEFEHVFDQKVATEAYLKDAATCQTKATYYYSCTCGKASETETFEGEYGAHAFEDGICTVCGGLAENIKFYFGVTSGNTVDVVVDANYNAVVRLPENGTVNTKSVSVIAALQNVASLGISGVRSHSIALNTGAALGENEVDLTKWLSNAYNFNGGKINAVIDGKAVTYTFDAVKDNKIAATTETAAARAAWQALTANVSTTTQAADDSSVVIANGSYIKIGTEYLRFGNEEGDLVIDNLNNIEGLNKSIRDAVYLDTCEDQGAVVEILVTKGTKLAVGQSIATLDKDCLITIDFGDADEIAGLKGRLTELRDAQSVYALVMDLVELFNDVVGAVDSVAEVNVVVGFDVHKHVFDQKVATEAYLKDAATCTSKALYYYSCACGEKGTDTFEYGEYAEHVYNKEVPNADYLKSEANCQSAAVYYKSCVCGAKGTETFEYGEKLPHVFDQQNIDAKYLASAATCTSKALYYYSCACGEVGTEVFEYGEYAEHVYNKEVATAEYLVSAGDCQTKAVYYKSCVCGKAGTETFEGEYGAHAFEDGICTVCGGLAENIKFYFGVTSENTVDMIVDANYNAVVRLPANGMVNTKSVSIVAALQNVASLGISGIRSHSIALNTGAALGENEVDLTKWLSNAYNFNGGKINAVIDGKKVTYTFDAVKDNKIAATTETAAARAAWQVLTANVSTEVQPTNDSSVVIANGSYIKLGTEYLRFENEEGDLVIDNLNNIEGLNKSIRDAVYLDTCEEQGAVVEILVTKGTKLAVGQSIATLDKDCLITIDFGDADEIAGLKGRLTELRDAQSVYTLVMDLVELFNDVVGVVDSVAEVNVVVGFDVHKHVFDQKVATEAYLKDAATCTSKAVYYYSCTCGEAGTETFEYGEYAEHVYNKEVATAEYLKSEATCQSAAVYYVSCVCGEKGTDTFLYGELGSHDFTGKNTDTKYLKRGATCQSPALYYYSCTVCGAAGTETFSDGATLDHTYTRKNVAAKYLASEATCQSPALYYYSCSMCGEKGTETFEYGEKLPHVFDQQNIDAKYLASAATCTSKALYYYSCACGEVGTEVFEYGEYAEHVFDQEIATEAYLVSAGDCQTKAVYYVSCVCGKAGTETFEGEYGAHAFEDGICTVCGGLAENIKFYFGVTSENTVDMIVDANYNAIVRLPANGVVNTKSVSIVAALQNVASLGISGIRSHSIALNTGAALGENEVDLTKWLSNAYSFDGGKINAVIDGKAVTYTFDAAKDNKIVATTETAAARAAWQALTANVSTQIQPTDDSKIIITNGSYIKIGTEYLRFENEDGDLVLDNLNDMSGLNKSIRDAVYLDTCEDQGAKVEILVAKGTKLAVGQSIATLEKDCLITIDFGDADEIAGLKGRLTELRDAQSVYALVMDLVELFNDVVGVVDSVAEVNVVFDFGTIPGDVDCDGDVDSDDAVYLLWYTFMPEDYPIKQSCDFNMDGEVNSDDAVYLLWNTFMPEDYPLYANK